MNHKETFIDTLIFHISNEYNINMFSYSKNDYIDMRLKKIAEQLVKTPSIESLENRINYLENPEGD